MLEGSEEMAGEKKKGPLTYALYTAGTIFGLVGVVWGGMAALEVRLVPRPEFTACTTGIKEEVAGLQKALTVQMAQADVNFWREQRDRAWRLMQQYPANPQFKREYEDACQQLRRAQNLLEKVQMEAQ